jgi:tRNA modification GTPase
MSLENDNIVAIATPYGVGAISIIRLSGNGVLQIAQSITRVENIKPRFAKLVDIYYENIFLDEVIIIYFKAPYSFSGEDIIEIQCHGGINIVNLILEEILKYDIRLANSGEFSKRAFLNGKIDLAKAETISALIQSKSKQSAKILAQNLKGNLSRFVDEIKELLIKSLSCSEVSIDYSDEELPSDLKNMIKDTTSKALKILKDVHSNSLLRSSHINGFKISIIGKPNVGKSSLLNKILLFDRAITSDIEGTTRDTIEESVTIGSNIVIFIDTAGIRDTANKIEKIGIEKSLESIKNSDIVIAMFDLSKKLDINDEKIIKLLDRYKKDKSIIVVKNKLDIKKENFQIGTFKELSLSSNENIEPLLDEIKKIITSNPILEDVILTSKRQLIATRSTIEHIENSFISLEKMELEIFSFHINEALSSISSITKPYEYSQMLDKMFGEFCLGK